MLRGCASVSSAIYLRLGLTREVTREALAELADARKTQVGLCSVICATRFKIFEGGILLRTQCQKCHGVDSFDHSLDCARTPPIPSPGEDSEPTVVFSVDLARRAAEFNTGIPIPWREKVAGDISLRMDTSGEEGGPLGGTTGQSGLDGDDGVGCEGGMDAAADRLL